MAQLNSLIVTGASRFLGKIYCGDLNVSGTSAFAAISATSISSTGTLSATGAATFSSTVTATGNIATSGAFYSGINGLYIYNKKAIFTSSTSDTWLRINDGKPFTSGVYFGTSLIRTDGELQVGSAGAYLKSNSTSTIIANLAATKAVIGNGEVTGDLVVNTSDGNGQTEIWSQQFAINRKYSNILYSLISSSIYKHTDNKYYGMLSVRYQKDATVSGYSNLPEIFYVDSQLGKVGIKGNLSCDTNDSLTFNFNTDIKYAGTKATYSMIRFIDNATDTYGNGIVIGGGGPTIIGGGESANAINNPTYLQNVNVGGEYMVVANDGAIQFFTNCGDMPNRNEFTMTSTGNFTAPGSITGNTTTDDIFVWARNENTQCYAALRSYGGSSGKGSHGLYSQAYYNSSTNAAVTSAQWMCYRVANDAKVHLDSAGSGTVAHGYFNCYGNNFSRGTGGLHCGVYRDDASDNFVSVHYAAGGNHGVWSSGYGTPASGNTAASMTTSGKWMIYRNSIGETIVNPDCMEFVGASTYGGYMDFHYNKSTDNYTTRIIENPSGILKIQSSTNGNLRFRTLSGNNDMPAIASVTTAKEQVGYVRCSSATGFGVWGLWATDATWKYMYASMTTSDPRLKDNIKPTEMNALELINKIPMYQFDWKADHAHWDVGFIAPEMYDIDPALVHKPKEDEEVDMWGVEGFYLTGVNTKAIQELSAENASLRKRIEQLEKIITERLGE